MFDWLSVTVRAALYVNLMLLFGFPLFGLYALNNAERQTVLPFRALVAGLALLGLALSVLNIVVITASMADVALSQVDWETLSMAITLTTVGTAWQARMCALVAALCFASLWGRRRGAALFTVMTLAAGSVLGSLAWTGHGAASEGRMGLVHLLADIIHLFAAGAWIGGIAAFGLLLFDPNAALTHDRLFLTHRALDRFSLVGSVVVGLIVTSGLVNSYMLVGPAHIAELPFTLYGQLLLAKLALFAAMLALAAANRFRLTPAFGKAIAQGDGFGAVAALRRSLAAEAGAALLILGLVAWIGTLAPPMSAM